MPGFLSRTVVLWWALVILGGSLRAADRPVLWYCLHYQAPGENRYPAQGAYSNALALLSRQFEVRVSDARPTAASLADVDVVLLANPNDLPHGTNVPPVHVSPAESEVWESFVKQGGGLLILGNQEAHNLEIHDLNGLLGGFGLALTNRYHDAKIVKIPATVPEIGGLRWAFYTGNEVVLTPGHPAQPTAWITNDVAGPTATGRRNEPGILLATAQLGRGRVVVATDAGWITRNALLELGIGDLTLRDQDNAEILVRLCGWLAKKSWPR